MIVFQFINPSALDSFELLLHLTLLYICIGTIIKYNNCNQIFDCYIGLVVYMYDCRSGDSEFESRVRPSIPIEFICQKILNNISELGVPCFGEYVKP